MQRTLYSFKLWNSVAIALECTVGNFCTVIVKERHDWLVHSSIPLYISWFSESVSVHILVILVEHWVLSGSPFSVCIWSWWVLWQDSAATPIEQVWVVCECLSVNAVIVHDKWSVESETSTKTTNYEVNNPSVSNPASSIEAFNWEFTNDQETENTSSLSSSGVVGPVEIRSVDWSGDFVHFTTWEPTCDNLKVLFGLWGP